MLGLNLAPKAIETISGGINKARAGWRAVKEAWSKDGSWSEKLAILTETYKTELEKLQGKKDKVKDKTEEELKKAAADTEGAAGEYENAIMPEQVSKPAPMSDIEEQRANNEAFSVFQSAVEDNFGDGKKEDENDADENPELQAALKKLQNQPEKAPENDENALTVKELSAFSAATINTWLDLTYDKDGKRIGPDQFSDLVTRLWKQQGRAKDLVKNFFRKNFQYAFTKMEQNTKLEVMSEFGVEAGVSDLFGSGQASQIRDALVVVGSKDSTGDRNEMENAARVLGPVFFPRTKVEDLADVLENVNDMITLDEPITPDIVAATFYNIHPADLKRLVSLFNSTRTKWGVNKVKENKAEGLPVAANDDKELPEAPVKAA